MRHFDQNGAEAPRDLILSRRHSELCGSHLHRRRSRQEVAPLDKKPADSVPERGDAGRDRVLKTLLESGAGAFGYG